MKLSLVVPCYNEEENVLLFFECVSKCFMHKIDDYEIVFVDDGSSDKTLHELKKLQNKDKVNIQIISFSRNFGKESAIYAGMCSAKGEMVCIIDADLQQRPEVVLEMLEILDKNPEVDCVAAYQEKRKENIIIAGLKSIFYKVIDKMADVDFVNGASDFRLMRKNMVDAVLSLGEYHRFSKGIFSWVGFKTEYIPYDVAEREHGESKWGTIKLIKYAVEGLVAFSTVPLKIATFIGIVASIFSMLYLLIVIIQKLFWGIAIPGYATIIVLMLLIGGLILFCLGIIGEYLARMYVQGKNRPIYIEKEHLEIRNE